MIISYLLLMIEAIYAYKEPIIPLEDKYVYLFIYINSQFC